MRPIEIKEPPERLATRVLHGVRREETRLALRRTLFVLCLGLAISAAGLLFALLRLADGMWQSGFSALASLLFSDTTAVLGHWQEFGYSLLETLPVTLTVAVLALAIACLHLSRRVLNDYANL